MEQLDTYYSNPIYYGSGKYDKFLKKYSRTIISKEESRQKITVRSVNKILQLILAHKNKYNVTAGKKFPKMEELNQQVQNLIDEYNKEDGVEKIPVSNFSFSLSSEEAEAIYHAGKLKYLNIIDKYLAGSGKIFNAEQIKNTNLFISLLSLSYQQGSLKLLNNIFYSGIEKSRFLIWFALRYKMAVLSDKSLRRLHDSVIFGLLEPRKDDAAQADIPAVINDIFAYLNYPQNKESYTSYLDYMKNLPENNIDEIAKDDNTVCFHKGNEYKIIFDSLLKTDSIENYFIDTSFLENKFLDNIIDFAPYDTIFSIFTQLIKESFGEELKAKKGSEELFLLENIYVVECINKEKFISLMELKYSSLQEKCNVFLFLNSTLDIVNDISYLQSKCPNVHFTIGIQAGYTYSFRLDDKSSAQTNIMLYSIKDGKYIPELLKDTFKAENISSEESQNEKNILLFSAEENNNLSGRLSNNANIFHITHQSAEKIISKIKLYNLISDKYEGNIQVDMQDKEYEVSAAKSSGEFNVDITLSILDKALNDEEINDKPYYMLVNSTGEIFESKVSNGKASFSYNPAEARSNQKVLFSFNKADLLCKKSANGKCLDFIHINKTYMENKQVERTFTINLMDILSDLIEKVELSNIDELLEKNDKLSNIDELLEKNDSFINEHHFNAYTSSENIDKIRWGYFTIPLNKLKVLYEKNYIMNEKEIKYIDTGDCLHFTPGSIFNEKQRKQLQQKKEVIIVVATFNKSFIFLSGSKGYNFYIIYPDKKPIVNKLQLSEKYTSYYGRSLHVTNLENEPNYVYDKTPALALKGNPKDDNIRKIYTFGIKIDAENYDENFNHFSYGIVGLKWLKIKVMTSYKAGGTDEEKKEKELSLKNTCKEILNKYKNNPLDIDFASLSNNNIEVTGNVSIIAASNSTKTSACNLLDNKYQGTIIYNEDENIYYYVLNKGEQEGAYYYVLNKGEQEGAVILCPFIDKPVLEQDKYIQLGFNAEDIANYMAREIENNLLHLQYSDYVLTYYKVYTDNCWDHKWQLSALFPSMGLSQQFYHRYNNKEIPYDVWANIHFGVIGSKINPSDFILLKGAGTEQIISDIKNKGNMTIKECFIRLGEFSGNYGDNEGDIEAIKIGVQISKDYEIKTVDIIVNQILTILQTYSRTQSR